jgi:hypothetical protein
MDFKSIVSVITNAENLEAKPRGAELIQLNLLNEVVVNFSVRSKSGNYYGGTLVSFNEEYVAFIDFKGQERYLRTDRLAHDSFHFTNAA